jgi:hypothetical protein
MKLWRKACSDMPERAESTSQEYYRVLVQAKFGKEGKFLGYWSTKVPKHRSLYEQVDPSGTMRTIQQQMQSKRVRVILRQVLSQDYFFLKALRQLYQTNINMTL